MSIPSKRSISPANEWRASAPLGRAATTRSPSPRASPIPASHSAVLPIPGPPASTSVRSEPPARNSRSRASSGSRPTSRVIEHPRSFTVRAVPDLWGLLAVSIGMTLVPGIDTAMVMRVTLRSDRRAGLLTAAGCATGLFVHAAAVAVGLAALVAASATAYQALKIAGAVFLIVAVAVIPVACSLGGLSLWAVASGGLRELLRSLRAQRIQERIVGTVLVALGLRVALER